MERDPKDVKIVCGLFAGLLVLAVGMSVLALVAIWLFGGKSEDRIAEQRDLAAQERGGGAAQEPPVPSVDPHLATIPDMEMYGEMYADSILNLDEMNERGEMSDLLLSGQVPDDMSSQFLSFNPITEYVIHTLTEAIGTPLEAKEVFVQEEPPGSEEYFLYVNWRTDQHESVFVRRSIKIEDKKAVRSAITVSFDVVADPRR